MLYRKSTADFRKGISTIDGAARQLGNESGGNGGGQTL
jgi:hypothetical protein